MILIINAYTQDSDKTCQNDAVSVAEEGRVHFPWQAGLVLDCRYQAMALSWGPGARGPWG